MRKVIAAIALEFYALCLAGLQLWGGVRSDEATYLLNIPYAHPPLLRWMLGSTSGIPGQELFWRIASATALIQAVWVVWFMARGFLDEQRSTLVILWLTTASLVLGAGSIAVAPLSALEGLFFLLCLSEFQRGWRPSQWQAAGLACCWLVFLLTAYQAVVFLPLVAALLWQVSTTAHRRLLYIAGPMLVAFLFFLAEPRLVASALHAGIIVSGTSAHAALGLFRAWCVGGSILLGLLGLSGMLLQKDWPLLLSTVLACLFVLASPQLSNAIVFTPLFIVGVMHFFRRIGRHPAPLIFPYIVVSLLCVTLFPPSFHPSPARAIVAAILQRGRGGDILLHGDAGHEWEYESPFPIRTFTPALLPTAQAVVCTSACPAMEQEHGWTRLPSVAVETWVRG